MGRDRDSNRRLLGGILNIRQENEGDFGAIYALVKKAFETAAMSQGDEQDYVDHIRSGDTYIPELSLVAESHTFCRNR